MEIPRRCRRGGENQRVVGGAVDFHGQSPAKLGNGITGGAMHLGCATQRIGVLDLRTFRVGQTDGAVFQKAAQIHLPPAADQGEAGGRLAGRRKRVVPLRVSMARAAAMSAVFRMFSARSKPGKPGRR